MRIRIVVADRGEARFYDTDHVHSPLRLAGQFTDPQAHLHDRDFKSDRPGRVFDHAATPGGRRGAVAHHGTGGERTPLKHEADVFAHQIARELESALQVHAFDRLVLMAEPAFLGLLRQVLPKSLMNRVVAQVHKDLVHQDEQAVLGHVPTEVFTSLQVGGV